MALTPEIRAANARVATVAKTSNEIRVAQAFVRTIYNYPTAQIRSSAAYVTMPIKALPEIRAPSAYLTILVRGRVAQPQVRAWAFTLDGHDFYVLRLGDDSTLIYDVYSEQWVTWDGHGLPFWRTSLGISWLGGRALADTYGSDIVVGDDTYGLLWFLDPTQPFDDSPDPDAPVQQVLFQRIVMGQVAVTGRAVEPCYAVWLTTDMGDPAYDGASVQLLISDDAGNSFDDMGIVPVTLDDNSPELAWYSLGQIEAPGRLFQIIDDGAVTRIDGMEMNDK